MTTQKPKLKTKPSSAFQPIQIGTQTSIEKDYQQRFEAKIKRFDALYSYLVKFIALEDKNVLKTNIYVSHAHINPQLSINFG